MSSSPLKFSCNRPGRARRHAPAANLYEVLLLASFLIAPSTALAANKTFTGTGNFSTATLWNGNSLPAAGDNLSIRGTCTFDNAANNLAYGTLSLGGGVTPGNLSWPAGGTNTLNVTAVSAGVAGSSINMTNGGTLQVRTSWSLTNMTFTPGAGTVHWNVTAGNSTLPATIATYNNLTITAGTRTVSLGVATALNGNLLISTGTLDVTTSNFALNVAGNFTNNATFTPRAGTVTLNGAGAQTLGGTASTSFNHLVLSGGGIKTLGTGTKTIGGNFTLDPGVTYDGATNNPVVDLAGDFSSSGTFNSGTGIFTFNGGSAQTLTGATTFTNLALDNTSTGLTVNNDLTVAGTLTFIKEKITTGANKVIIGSAGSIAGASGSSYVVGTLQKAFTAAGSFTFAIGDSTNYTHVDLTITALSSAGSLEVFQTPSEHPNIATSTLDPTLSVNRYWTFTASGGLAGTYDATFNYVTGDKDSGSNPPDFEIERFSGGTWYTLTEGTKSGNSTQATGLTSFSSFAIAEPATTANHFVITHDGTGVNCEPEVVTVTGHKSNHSVLTTLTSTITLEAFKDGTGTLHGDWTLNTGLGTFTPGAADSGTATYTFVSGDNGQAVFNIRYTYPETVNINVTSGARTENSGTANNGSEPTPTDPTLTFYNSGFRVTNGSNSVVTIGQQISGKESNINPGSQTLALQAIRTDTNTFACVSVFANNAEVDIDMASECADPAACAGEQVRITTQAASGNVVDIANYDSGTVPALPGALSTVKFKFVGANSEAPFTLNYPDVGAITLHARRNIPLESGAGSGNFMVGSEGPFLVRPFGFHLGLTGNPAAADETGGVFAKAGNNFDVDVSSVVWETGDDDGGGGGTANDGIPDPDSDLSGNAVTPNFGNESTSESVTITRTLLQPAAGSSGTLSGGGPISLTSGTTTAALSWDEVGIIRLDGALSSSPYLTSSDNITGSSRGPGNTNGYVGRVVPDRFDVAANAAEFAHACTGGSDDFTYRDQAFYYQTSPSDMAPVLTVTALNEAGGTTNNYGANFWKLIALLEGRTYVDQSGHAAQFNSVLGNDATLSDTGDLDGDGTLTLPAGDSVGDAFMYTRNNTPEAPFNADVDFVASVADLTDTDNICYDSNNDGTCEAFTVAGITGSGAGTEQQRWGRLVIGTAAGSELLPLSVPMQAEYFDGTAFILNNDDSCSAIAATDLILDSSVEAGQVDATIDVSNAAGCADGTSTATIANNPLSGGLAGLSLSAPGVSCTGKVEMTVDLSTATGIDLEWLRFNWIGGGAPDEDPSGEAAFGIFRGEDELIYRREPWN